MTRTLALALLAALLAGCLTAHMDVVPQAERRQSPPPGSALVVFVRPAAIGGSSPAVLVDGDEYIGTLDTYRHIDWVARPGRHIFAVMSEAADFMEADLEAGKTYYATVRRRMGFSQDRLSFIAHNDPRSIDEARELEAETDEVRPNDEGRRYYEGKRAMAAYLKGKYAPVWQKNPNKQVLLRESGR